MQTLNRMWRLQLSGLLLLAIAVNAQQKSPPSEQTGVVSGRIFAITKDGDLKPARLAKVYLFYTYRSAKAANASPAEETNSAAHVWSENLSKLTEGYLKALDREGASWSDSLMCHKKLLTYVEALSATADWAADDRRVWQMLTTNADENGVFKVTVHHPGKYALLAYGQAGFSKAVWEDDDIVVNPGVTTTGKLSSPAEACLAD